MSCRIFYRGEEFKSVQDFTETLQNQTLADAELTVPDFNDVRSRDKFLTNTFNLIKVDERYQVTASQKEALENWQKRYQAPLEFVFSEVPGVKNEHFLKVVSESQESLRAFGPRYSKELESSEKEALEFLARLGQVFPNLSYTIVDPQDLKQEEHLVNINEINSFIKGNKVHLVRGRITKERAIEEALHPFVHILKNKDPETYQSLLENAQQEYPELFTSVQSRYAGVEGYDTPTIAEEFLTQALAKEFSEKNVRTQDTRPIRSSNLLFTFLDKLQNYLFEALEFFGIEDGRMFWPSGKTTLAQMAEYLHLTDRKLWVRIDDKFTRYSKEESENAKKNLAAQNDEALIRRSLDFKIKQAESQKSLLEKIKAKGNDSQSAALDKLIASTEKYLEQLDVEKEYFENTGKRMASSVSVSKFIGSTEFDGDSSIYQKFADFGTFMHNFLEDIAEEILLSESNAPAIDFFTREKFDKALAKHQKGKSAFEIENLSADEMYLQAKQILQIMLHSFSNGNIVIPEFTVMANYGGFNEKVLGRLDVMVIDQFGKINIVDFKTKKVKTLIQNEEGHQDIAQAHKELATNDKAINELEGTHPAFANISRTTFDTWNVQLKVYERMLAQNGLDVGETSIVSLLYQTDEDLKYQGGTVYHFRGNFYELAGGTIVVNGVPHDVFSEVGKQHYERFAKAVKESIPLEKDKEEKLEKRDDAYFLDFSKDQLLAFIDILKNTSALELENMKKRRAELYRAKRPDGERMYSDEQIDEMVNNQRIITLETFSRSAERILLELGIDDKTDTSPLTVSAQIKLLIQILESDINELNRISKGIRQEIKTKRAEGTVDLGEYTARFREVFMNVQSMEETLNFLREVVADKIDDGSLDPEAHIVKLISNLDQKNSVLVNSYKDFAIDVFADIILKGTSAKGFEKISAEMREALKPDLEGLYRKREKMLAQDKVGKMDLLRLKTIKYLDPVRYQKISKEFSEDDVRKSYAFEQLEEEIKLLELKIEHGHEYSIDYVRKLIKGVTDPNSVSYIGRNRKTVPGFNADSWIASASNSDMGIAGVANMLKITSEAAKDDFMDFMQENDFQKLKDDFSEGRTMQEMNEILTERREHLMVDKETGEVSEEKRQSALSFVSPVSQEYEQKLQEFNIKDRQLGKRITELKNHINKRFLDMIAFSADDRLTLTKRFPEHQELIELYTQRDNLYKERRDYLKEHTHLEYVDEYYEIYDIPSEFLSRINEIKAEEQAIQNYIDESSDFSDLENLARVNQVHVDNVESLVFDRLSELEVEKKKLRLMALKVNPRFAEIMDRRDQFTSYDKIRWNQFETVKARKEQAYADNPKAMQRWLDRNTVIEPTQEWRDRIEELNEEKEAIASRDETLKELFDERREILAPYRTSSGKDYRFIPKEELDALDFLEDAIASRLETLRKSKSQRLSKAERKRLREINQELSTLQRQENNKKYEKEKEEMLEMLLKARAHFNNIQRYAETNLESLLNSKASSLEVVTRKAVINNMFQSEQAKWERAKTEFSKWYKQYHRVKTDASGQITEFDIETDKPTFKGLRSFVQEIVPAQDQHRQVLPSNKWRKPEVKESAKNPKHKKLPNGLALPKALTIDEKGNVVRNSEYTGSLSAVNQKFLDLLNDDKAKKFYDAMMSQYFSLQNRTSGNKLGYSIPGKQATMVQNLMSHKADLATFAKKEIARRLDNSLFRGVSEMDKVTNEYGDNLDQVRFRFNHQFSEDIQSEDAINATFIWMLEAHINEKMNLIKSQVDVALDSVRLQKQQLENNDNASVEHRNRIKELQDLHDILTFERNKHIAGVYEKADLRQLKKAVDTAFGIISFGRLAFSTAGQLKNMFAGNIQSFLGSTSSEYYNDEDLLWAKGQLYKRDGFFGDWVADWGKVGNLSLATTLYRRYNPLQKDYSEWLDLTTGSSRLRAIEKASKISELAYLMQDKGDMEIATTLWLAIMRNMQVPVYELDADGNQVEAVNEEGHLKTISLYEAYVLDEKGKLTTIPEVGDISEYEKRAKKIVWSEIRRTQGNYAKMDQTMIEQTLVGRMQMFYRKYLVPQLLNRFGYGREDWEAERYTKGYWRAITNMWKNQGPKEAMKHLILGFGGLRKIENSKANSFYARHATHASRDFYVSVLLTALSSMALSMVRKKKEDDEEIGFLTGNMIQLLWGVRQETTAFTPVPMVMNVDEYIRSVSSYSTAFGDITKMYKAGTHALMAMVGLFVDEENSEFWSEVLHDGYYQRKSGMFEKGDAKLMKDFYDLTGYKNIDNLFNPRHRISMMMKYQ